MRPINTFTTRLSFMSYFVIKTYLSQNYVCFLFYAHISGKIASVKFLISNGARVDAQDVDGETALHKAVQSKNCDLVTELLQACPKLENIADHKGRLPLTNS